MKCSNFQWHRYAHALSLAAYLRQWGILYLNIPAANSVKATLSVTNVSGQVVLKDEVSVTTGNNKVPVKVNNLSAGTYIIKVQLGTQTFTQKFNKQ